MSKSDKAVDLLKVEDTQHELTVDRRYSIEAAFSPEDRIRIEKKLKRKLDARFSILIVIYILNCEFQSLASSRRVSRTNLPLLDWGPQTLTVKMHLKRGSRVSKRISACKVNNSQQSCRLSMSVTFSCKYQVTW